MGVDSDNHPSPSRVRETGVLKQWLLISVSLVTDTCRCNCAGEVAIIGLASLLHCLLRSQEVAHSSLPSGRFRCTSAVEAAIIGLASLLPCCGSIIHQEVAHSSLPLMGCAPHHFPLTEQRSIAGKTTKENIDNPIEDWNVISVLPTQFLQELFRTLQGVD